MFVCLFQLTQLISSKDITSTPKFYFPRAIKECAPKMHAGRRARGGPGGLYLMDRLWNIFQKNLLRKMLWNLKIGTHLYICLHFKDPKCKLYPKPQVPPPPPHDFHRLPIYDVAKQTFIRNWFIRRLHLSCDFVENKFIENKLA